MGYRERSPADMMIVTLGGIKFAMVCSAIVKDYSGPRASVGASQTKRAQGSVSLAKAGLTIMAATERLYLPPMAIGHY